MATPQLPTRFPCWVKAVYSWGGESKRDLGFMEGDLIECLNAGDGMWWMGRLRRDRRMVGLFPSNFVKVLEDNFQPTPRASPLTPQSTSRSNSQTTNAPTTPTPSKTLFRKPFKSYAKAGAPNPEAAARELLASSNTPSPKASVSTKPNFKPYSSMHKSKTAPVVPQVPKARPQSPTIPAPIARASSHRPSQDLQRPSRAPSPSPQSYYSRPPSPSYQQHISRQPSYAPSFEPSRQPSPAPESYDDEPESSPPPPPPPTHRVAYTRQASPEGYFDGGNHRMPHPIPRTPSPAVSERRGGMTPSPLRDAMADVMSSLEGMGGQQEYDEQEHELQEPEPHNPWSPEAFGEIYRQPSVRPRPHTSMAVGHEHENEDDGGGGQYYQGYQGQPDQLESYVQRMESRLRHNRYEEHADRSTQGSPEEEAPPPPPQRGVVLSSQPCASYAQSRPGSSQADSSRPSSSYATSQVGPGRQEKTLKHRKSAYELGRERLQRTFTTKSSVTTASSTAQSTSTNNSNSTAMTSQSIMSGQSAGGFSATSAGSLARRKFGRSGSVKEISRPQSAMGLQPIPGAVSTVSYHSSNDSTTQENGYDIEPDAGASILGGFAAPSGSPKKRGFFGKMMDKAKTSAANARSTVGTSSSSRPPSRQKVFVTEGISSSSSRPQSRNAAREMGLAGSTGDWVNMRRDVNRSNSLSRNERNERIERCQMSDIPVLTPVETLNDNVEGDEDVDCQPVRNFQDISACNFTMVDKSARFVNNLPALINSASLAQGYLCRPYKSDAQRLRAIFTWVSERITWEEDFEGGVDTRRVIQSKRGCSEEIAVLVAEMCSAIGIPVEIIRGHLKIPGELSPNQDLNEAAARPNHWWNAVIADDEWRIMDCSLANPTNPRRSHYSSVGNQISEPFWFLTRPSEICYTHVPLLPEQQHIVPPVAHETLMALPIASPPYFKHNLQMWDFDTSLLNLEGLEMAHVQFTVPEDIECVATVSARSFALDFDGDFFESGEDITKRALAQGDFISVDSSQDFSRTSTNTTGQALKRYTVKAFVPSTSDQNLNQAPTSNTATLRIHAGRRGLMHSINHNPHPLALTLPLIHHSGSNPSYDFFTRHPTPHALRHELYVLGPLCKRLAWNNTFVFGVRQHPASGNWSSIEGLKRPGSSAGLRAESAMGGLNLSVTRPGSAMSMASISASGSAYSAPSATGSDGASDVPGGLSQVNAQKPAKLAIQSPSGKILRMTRKAEAKGRGGGQGQQAAPDEEGVVRCGSHWETIIKIGERGVWRGLVLADRSARWCVFGEWECV